MYDLIIKRVGSPSSDVVIMNSSRFALAAMDSVRVSREGQRTVEIALAQLTPSSVARVFSVSLHLLEGMKACTL